MSKDQVWRKTIFRILTTIFAWFVTNLRTKKLKLIFLISYYYWKDTPNGSLSMKVISTEHSSHFIQACPHFSVHFHTWKQQHIVNGLKLPLNLLTRVRDSNWNVPRFMAFKCKLFAYSKGVFPLGKWNPFVMLYEWGTYTSRMVSSNFAPKNM